MSWVDRLFPALILRCMGAGITLGKLAPGVGRLLEPWIPLGLFLMIYPTVAKVPFHAVRRSALEGSPAVLSMALNYLVNPLLLFGFGWLFLRSHPDLWTGLVLLGLAPCIGMVLVWADLGGADNALSVSLMAWNSLIQIVSVPLWLYLLVGTRVGLPSELILQSTALCLGLPLVAAHVTRQAAVRARGEAWFEQRLGPVLGVIQRAALLATLVVMFALKRESIVEAPETIGLLLVPRGLFLLCLFALGTAVACLG